MYQFDYAIVYHQHMVPIQTILCNLKNNKGLKIMIDQLIVWLIYISKVVSSEKPKPSRCWLVSLGATEVYINS